MVRFAVVVGEWKRPGEGRDYVDCVETLDSSGTQRGATIRIFFIPHATKDPAVDVGAVLMYDIDQATGDAVCLGDAYGAKIGTIQWWGGPPDAVPNGWEVIAPTPGFPPTVLTIKRIK